MFNNRQDAGRRLANAVRAALSTTNWSQRVVVALPRGGVPVATEVASLLRAPLTILVSKKIGAPYQQELAIGAVTSTGTIVLNEELSEVYQSHMDYVTRERQRLLRVTASLESGWLRAAGLPARPSFTDKCVILVDDGIATGMTALAAIRSIQEEHPAHLVVATPVISATTMHMLNQQCDGVVSLAAPAEFGSVSQFYQDFHQVDDAEMVRSLRDAAQAPAL